MTASLLLIHRYGQILLAKMYLYTTAFWVWPVLLYTHHLIGYYSYYGCITVNIYNYYMPQAEA